VNVVSKWTSNYIGEVSFVWPEAGLGGLEGVEVVLDWHFGAEKVIGE
jgi:hypothetical protein